MSSPPTTAVTVPAEPENLRVLRVLAAHVAAGAELGLDRYDDLELAIGEAGALLLHTGSASLSCELRGEPGLVEVRMAAPGAVRPLEVDELSTMVLDAVTESYDVQTGATAQVTFTIRA